MDILVGLGLVVLGISIIRNPSQLTRFSVIPANGYGGYRIAGGFLVAIGVILALAGLAKVL